MDWIMWYTYFAIFVAVYVVGLFLPGKLPNFGDEVFERNNTTVYKGIAITIIILAHFMNEFGHGIRWFTPLGGIGVAVFLLLSGYGLNESWSKSEMMQWGDTDKPYDKWWRKRIVSVFIPYVIVQIILYWPFHAFNITAFLLDLTCIKPLYHNGWYLNYLLIMYIMFYCVQRFVSNKNIRFIIYLSISIIILIYASEMYAEQAFSFTTGVTISSYKDRIHKKFKIRNIIFLLILGVGFLTLKQLPVIRQAPQVMMNGVQLFIKLPLGLSFILLAFYCGRWIHFRVSYRVGLISYELYLIHGYCLKMWNQSIMDAILFILVSVLLSIAFWKGYEIVRKKLYISLKLRK